MKQHYRRLTAVLLLAGLLLGMSACGGATQDNTAAAGEPVRGAAVESSGTVAANERYTLSWDEENKAVFLTDKHTGRRWGTEPTVPALEEGRGNVLSRAALVLSYAEPNALGPTSVTSTVGAGRNGRVLAYAVADGIRVEYWFR